MIVTDGPFFSGLLVVFCLIVLFLFCAGVLISRWLGLEGTQFQMVGPLIVFCALWWIIRYRRRKKN
ncbi:hypothetical protein [Succinimonas sp.]|uniref:hypothetical protein n=1 Tax=Succinimonas sp. TaxID=1936151 RepID=UPI0038694CAD